MRDKALDCTVWRTDFERRYGPIARLRDDDADDGDSGGKFRYNFDNFQMNLTASVV